MDLAGGPRPVKQERRERSLLHRRNLIFTENSEKNSRNSASTPLVSGKGRPSMHAHSLFRPLAFAAACFTVVTSAVADTFGNFTYTSDGTSVTITGHANIAVSSIVFPAEINGVPVRTIARLGPQIPTQTPLRQNVQSVTIPEGVTTIDPSAFIYFTALQSITLPNSVTSVGEAAFRNCTALTSATLGNGILALESTFSGCTSLTTVDLPDQLTTLDSTFLNCSSLTAIQIPASVTTIQTAFSGCTSLASVALPAGLTALGSQAFSGCTGLQNMIFPNGLVSIGDSAFYNCPGLTSLSLPPSVASIGNGAFQACTGLTSLTVPDTVTTIGDNAFWACPNLTSFDLPPRFLASISNIGLDYRPELASDALEAGIADRLANNPAFISKLADAIIAKNGHYGLSTQADLANVVSQTPQTVRDVISEIGAGSPPVHGITSDLGMLTVKKGKEIQYVVSTTFSATAFFASGLPDGVTINPTTGMISGKARKPGVYHVLLNAGVPGGGVVSAVKSITVMP
jgi:hypothetical protein